MKSERLTDEGQSLMEQMYSCKTIKELREDYDFDIPNHVLISAFNWLGQLDDFDDTVYILIHGFKMGLKYAKLKPRGTKR